MGRCGARVGGMNVVGSVLSERRDLCSECVQCD